MATKYVFLAPPEMQLKCTQPNVKVSFAQTATAGGRQLKVTATAEAPLLLQLWLQECVPRGGFTIHVFRYLVDLQQYMEVDRLPW